MNPDTVMNIAKSFKMLSVWVAFAVCGLAQYWLSLPLEEQQEWLKQWPVIKTYGPQIAFIVWYASRVKSQGGISLPWEVVPASAAAVVPIAGGAAQPAPVVGNLTPHDIEALLEADRILKANSRSEVP